MSQYFTQDFITSRRNYDDGTSRIGQLGRLWYDSFSNTIRIGDGTPGGLLVGGGGGGGALEIYKDNILVNPLTSKLNFEGPNFVVANDGPGQVSINVEVPSIIFDGGFPSSVYSTGPVLDAGGVT